MIATNKIRFGLVGAGGIAQAYAQAFRETNLAHLVAIADVRTEAAEAIAQTVNGKAYSTHREMIDAHELDAVIVCTPPVSHPDICCDIAEQGINVLCEKPLAITSADARRMFETAEVNGVKLTMASKFRYAEDVVRAKALVSSGILGDIILFENVFTSRVDMANRWNSKPAISGGGVLIDNGTHSVDIMRYLFGPVAELQVVEGKRVQNLEVEDTVRMLVKTTGGVIGNIDLSWSMNKEQSTFLSIYGSQGTVLVGWKESKYRRSNDTEWIVFGQGYNKFQAFRGQIDNFSRAIKGDDKMLVSPEDALASVEVIEAAYESLNNSQWQPVEHEGWQASVRTASVVVATK